MYSYYNDYNPTENEFIINTKPLIVDAISKEEATKLILKHLVDCNLISADAKFRTIQHELYRMNKYNVWLHTCLLNESNVQINNK